MHPMRQAEVLKQLLSVFAEMNKGPGQNVPVKTLWLKLSAGDNPIPAQEFNDVISQATAAGFLVSPASAPLGGLGTVVALTDLGYEESRRF